jgi:glutathione S-transferase
MRSALTLYVPDSTTIRAIECSPPSWMIQLALEEKELDFEIVRLSLTAGEHRSPEMLARNPRGKLPVLTDGPLAVYETFAILDFLEHTYPEPALLPANKALRGLALTRLHESGHLKTVGMELFSYIMSTRGLDLDPAEVDRRAAAFHDELFYWEYYYGLGKYAAGSQVTYADLSVFTYLATAVHLGLPLDERYPNLARFYERMKKRIAVVTTWPPWKSTPYRYLSETV